jgi:SAM-dependent methyltransferase
MGEGADTQALGRPAEAYDRHVGRYGAELASALVEVAGVRPGQRALDAGCGPGPLTQVLADRLGADNVAAVDPSEPFVAARRARVPGADVRVAVAEELRASTTCSHRLRRARVTPVHPFWRQTSRSSGACAPRRIASSPGRRARLGSQLVPGGPAAARLSPWGVQRARRRRRPRRRSRICSSVRSMSGWSWAMCSRAARNSASSAGASRWCPQGHSIARMVIPLSR